MSNQHTWFRAYSEMVDDAKLRLLAFEDRWHYVAILCCKAQGLIDQTKPELLDRVVGLKLGLDSRTLDEVRRRLVEVELIDKGWQPLGWDRRQFVSDTSAERTRKWRERKTSPTPPPKESKTDTDTDTEGDVTSDVTVTSRSNVSSIGTPPGLNAPEFRRWEEYLTFSGKRLNDLSRPAAMRKLVAFGDAAQQAAAVEHSIANGYRQLVAPRTDAGATPAKPFTRRTADELEAECRARGEDPYALIR